MENEVTSVRSENEEAILRDMEETRTSLTEKLETLEQKFVDTMHQTTTAVNETVASVKDTVNETVTAVKESVTDTVSSVKETMHEGVETVKDVFDLNAHVNHHPWLVMGGSVAAGFALGRLLSESSPSHSHSAFPPLRSDNTMFHSAPQKAQHTPPASPSHVADTASSLTSGLLAAFAPELEKLKGLALGVTMGTVRELVTEAVPPQIGQQLREVIDNVTRKIGGEPISSADWPSMKATMSHFHRQATSSESEHGSHPSGGDSWDVLKDKTKRIWHDITDIDLQRCKGDYDLLLGVIEERTGQTREQIRRALEESNGHHAAH